MAPPTTTIWEREPHTAAKHQLLGGYLAAWMPIMAQGAWSKAGCTYVDAFAGPGTYSDGSEGSPLIAIQAANRHDVTPTGTRVNLVFVEKDRDRFDNLVSLVDGRIRNLNCILSTQCAPCEDVLLSELDRLDAWSGPILVNFDGWGVDTPYDLVERIGRDRHKAHEVLITFQAQWFARFANATDIEAGNRVYGSAHWRAVASLAAEKKKTFLVEEYRSRLHDAGFPFSLVFELVDEGGHELFLVYGTTNLLGVEKMKDAMWAVDPIAGSRFRDPRDPRQMAFDLGPGEPNLDLLRRQILLKLEAGPRTLADLQDFTLRDTVFKAPHATTAVRDLVADELVKRGPGRAHADVLVQLAEPKLF